MALCLALVWTLCLCWCFLGSADLPPTVIAWRLVWAGCAGGLSSQLPLFQEPVRACIQERILPECPLYHNKVQLLTAGAQGLHLALSILSELVVVAGGGQLGGS